MVQYYPENTWHYIDLVDSPRYHQRRLHAKQHSQHRAPPRRRSTSKQHYRQQHATTSPPFQQYTWPCSFEDEQDIYEAPLSYMESYESMPDDLIVNDDYDDYDDYNDYMNAAPFGPRRSSSSSTRLHPPPPQRRRSLAYQYQPDYDYDYYAWNNNNIDDDNDEYENYLTNDNEQRRSRQTFKNYHHTDSRLRRRRSFGPPPPPRSTYGNYSDNEEQDDIIYLHQQQQNRSRHHHQHRASWTNSSHVMGSPESITTSPALQHGQMEQGPPPPPVPPTLLSIDTQQQQQHLPNTTAPFYGQVPSSILPMPQPMIPPLPPVPSSFLPYYGFPTIPTIIPAPPPPPPFNPMMMPPPPHLIPEKQPSSSVSSPTNATDVAAAPPSRPSSDDAKSPSSAPDLTTTTSPINSTTSTISKGENGLVPLARSLSLGTSQSIRTKPPGRRRSLFGSLFGQSSSDQQQQQQSSSSTTTPTSSPSLIPVQDLTRASLTRKQSLSLEKKARALSQRSYIWCYRIKPSMTHRHVDPGWNALTPKNQTKLDSYLVFYQPGAVVKGLIRTETLPTLVTLDKEPKLNGSITVMPQAKIARVYPSMFSSSNYMELVIDCLPADSQFVVRSDLV